MQPEAKLTGAMQQICSCYRCLHTDVPANSQLSTRTRAAASQAKVIGFDAGTV